MAKSPPPPSADSNPPPGGAPKPFDFLPEWFDQQTPDAAAAELVVLREKNGSRPVIRDALRRCVREHFAGLDIVERIGGYKQALAYIRNKLPSAKRARSGDFGEVLATEYVDQCTDYRVPIKKLRWKDDRQTTMRGNDVLAIKRQAKAWKILKGESKSRAKLSNSVVEEAVDGLLANSGRPNASSLAFISSRLRELGRDDEAKVFETLQRRQPRPENMEHLVFTLSGNVPTSYLLEYRADGTGIPRHLVGCVIGDHQAFIQELFEDEHAGNT